MGYRQAIDADLKACFDSLPHEGVLETERWAARGGHSPERRETARPRTPCTPPRQCSTLLVVLCNGTQAQAEALREELYLFLKSTLRLELSQEKTRITHLNDGFKFLGFWMQRAKGHDGMKTKVTIPQEAMDKIKGKIGRALAPASHQDSITSNILALNRIIGGWCRYYQHTSRAATQYRHLADHTFWCMAHWLGRKFKLTMPAVMQRFRSNNTFATEKHCLLRPTEFPTLQYKQRFLKPNPYLTQDNRGYARLFNRSRAGST